MTIADGRFGAALTTQKGRVYKFDDLSCLVHYKNENKATGFQQFYVSDFTKSNVLILVEQAFLIKGEEVRSPMRGDVAAFSNAENAKMYLEKFGAASVEWKVISN